MASQGLKRPHVDPSTVSELNMLKKRCTSFGPQFKLDSLGGAHSSSPFKDPATILTPLNEDINHVIKNEMIHRANDHHRSTSNNDPPMFTVRQIKLICEKVIRDREQKLREEYDKILISRLSEQYDTFVKYTHDHIEKRYNETNSHQASYLS